MIAVVLIQNTDSQHFTALSTFTFHTASEFSDITYLHTLTYSVWTSFWDGAVLNAEVLLEYLYSVVLVLLLLFKWRILTSCSVWGITTNLGVFITYRRLHVYLLLLQTEAALIADYSRK